MAKFRHVGIIVNNLKDSLYFYKKFFNFKIEITMNEGGEYLNFLWNKNNAKIKSIKLSDNTNKISLELIQIETVEGIKKNSKPLDITDMGITHFALTVKNIEKLYEKMKKEDVKFLNKPILSKDKKAKVVFCQDPTGCFIELVEILN